MFPLKNVEHKSMVYNFCLKAYSGTLNRLKSHKHNSGEKSPCFYEEIFATFSVV